MCFRSKARTLETEVLCFLFVAEEGSQRANYMQPSKIIPLIPANATPATMPGAPAAWPRNAPTSFHVLGKPSGATCNLDCTYCFFLSKEKLYPDSRFRMTDDLLEAYIHQMIESQRGPEVTIAWQGGEPTLMGLDFYKRSIEYEKKYARPGTTIQHTMQTNGILLNDAWCEFFREHDFLIGLSLDGPQEMHDTYRVDKGGAPTFHKVMRAARLLQQHRVEFNGNQVSERSVTAEQWGTFLITIFDEWVRRDVGTVFVQIFDAALASWVGVPPALCIFSETCGNALALEHNGDLYSCDHFVEPKYLLGNITQKHMIELVASDRQRQFGLHKRDSLPKYCRECEVRFACHGECPKNRFIETPDGEPGLNYLCAGYKAFFKHIDRPMRLMAELLRRDRAPAEVMLILAAEEAQLQKAFARAGRNDPCPCGSGRKFKHCHGR